MDGLEELSRAERHGDPAAQVAHLDPYPGGAEHAVRQVHGAADCGSRTLRNGYGVAGVVAVAVGDENEVSGYRIRGYGRQGVSGQERIGQHPIGAVGQQKTGVA